MALVRIAEDVLSFDFLLSNDKSGSNPNPIAGEGTGRVSTKEPVKSVKLFFWPVHTKSFISIVLQKLSLDVAFAGLTKLADVVEVPDSDPTIVRLTPLSLLIAFPFVVRSVAS